MPDRFIYILLPIPFLILAAVIFILRKDLRRRIIKVGLIGGVAGWVVNIWYFIDYWRPPSLFGHAVFSLEDFLAGFSIAAVGVTLYPFLTKTFQEKSTKKSGRMKSLLIVFLIGVASFVFFVNVLKVNSAAVSLSLVTVFAVGMIIRQPRLLKPALVTGSILALIGLVDYFFLFHVFSTGYLDRYFLLTNKPYDPTLFGFYPLLELAWYFTWGLFAGIFIDYLTYQNAAKNRTKTSKALS